MFIAFMPLYILLCDEVLLYFILWIKVVQNLNLNHISFVNPKKIWKLKKGFLFSLAYWAET
jgi:hypothetical protein